MSIFQSQKVKFRPTILVSLILLLVLLTEKTCSMIVNLAPMFLEILMMRKTKFLNLRIMLSLGHEIMD